MCEFICQHITYRRTNKTASLPTGLDGIVVLLDGYEASLLLRYCNTVKLIWSGKIKQKNARLIWKYVGYYRSTKHIQTDVENCILTVMKLRYGFWYSNTVKLIWSGEKLQMKEGFMWIYVGYCVSTERIPTDILDSISWRGRAGPV